MPETVQQFSARIKAKYPQYQSVPDDELAKRIVAKYPQYQSAVSFDAPAAQEPERPFNPVGDFQTGALKGIGSTIYGATQLINKGIRAIPGADKYVPPFPEKPEMLKPANTAQKIGYGAEQVAEFFVPGGAVAKAEKAVKGGKLLKAAARVGAEAAAAGGVTAVQTGGDMSAAKQSAAFAGASAAAFPAATGLIRKLSPKFRNQWSAVEQSAVGYLESLGVPVSAGQKLGSEQLQRLEQGLKNTPGASRLAQDFFEKQQDDLAKAGQSLIGRAAPAGSDDSLTQGASVLSRLKERIGQAKEFADKRYAQVRATLANPKNKSVVQVGTEASSLVDEFGQAFTKPINKTFEAAVDVSRAQQDLRPVYEELMKTMPEARRQASPGFQALREIIDGPPVKDALAVDRDLGAIKTLLRNSGSGGSYLTSRSQGLARFTISKLSITFDDAVKKAGGDAPRKLFEGRKAVQRYHEIADFLDNLPKNPAGEIEPVGLYNRLLSQGDRSAYFLEEVNKFAPTETRQLGRTMLQGLLDRATSEGGFKFSAGLMRDWNKLGPKTKSILFDKKSIEEIDKFLLGAKRLTVDLNPSGSTKTLAALGPVGALLHVFNGPGNVIARVGGLAATAKSNQLLARILLEPGGAAKLNTILNVNPNAPAFVAARNSLNGLLAQIAREEE